MLTIAVVHRQQTHSKCELNSEAVICFRFRDCLDCRVCDDWVVDAIAIWVDLLTRCLPHPSLSGQRWSELT